MNSKTLMTLLAAAILISLSPSMAVAEPVEIPLDKLYATPIEQVPEQVHVTDMLDS